MKKIFYLLMILFVSTTAFGQKKEVKAAEKALRKGNLEAALSDIQAAEKLLDQADDKTMARFYYTEGAVYKALFEKSKKFDDAQKAVKAFEKDIAFEKKAGINKYAEKSQAQLQALARAFYNEVNKANNAKDYATAEKYMSLVYKIEPTDDNLYILALLKLYNNDNESAYQDLKKLYEKKYTGIRTVYTLTEKETGKKVQVKDEKQQKLLLKTGQYVNPEKTVTKNRRPEIISNMLYALNKLGRDDEAYKIIQQAKKEDPDNVDLLLGEANYYLKKKDNANFTRVMEEAFKLDPKNAKTAYNVAIGYLNMKKYDKAEYYFNKVLELDPKNADAVYGLALIKLKDEKDLVDKINKNINNFKKYDELKGQLKKVYQNALPYLEKYYKMRPNEISIVKTLMNIYSELDMNDKYKEMRAKYKALKAAQK